MAMVFFGLDFKLSPMKAHISEVMVENGEVRGYFYVVSLDSGLRFPLSDFMAEILTNYEIALSQLVSNS